MSDTEILAALGEIVQEATGIPADRVVPAASFTNDLDIDSLSMVEIATMAEDRFNVSIPDAELSKLKTVADVVDFLSKAGVAA
ncbi:MAG TPA: acyl carrier protein [Mycobacteriales bacterium]|jgi:acyl carrier protein|nr:acyl carrier protein [Mycobacteriales bacterium]